MIGIPNCTYLLSRYHYDYRKSGNQVLAMTRVIRKIGLVTLMNNTTTAIGFFVFCFTDIAILYQFGLVATINIFVAFVISFILIPAVFTYLPPPTPKQLEHLDAKPRSPSCWNSSSTWCCTAGARCMCWRGPWCHWPPSASERIECRVVYGGRPAQEKLGELGLDLL
ncbi:MAG: MMPL family transporter [Hymenobacter sp.]